jgi:peroxiredoxin
MFRRIGKLAVLALAALTLASLTAFAQGDQETLRTLDGRAVNLSEQRGKVVVISFGGTWLPMASRDLAAYQKLADRYAARGVQFYWVSINSDKPGARNFASNADLQAFVQKNNLRIQALRDPDQQVYRSFKLDAVPTVLVLDQNGAVARKHVGFSPDQGEAYTEIIRVLEQLLK